MKKSSGNAAWNTSLKMEVALAQLDEEGIHYRRTTEYQLKVGSYSYYPDKGTIFMDGNSKAHTERGLDTFITLIRKLRDRNPGRFQTKSPTIFVSADDE